VEVFVRAPSSPQPDTLEAYLVVLSNDPDENPLVIEVSLEVTPTGIADADDSPSKFRLAQSIPNPFTHETEIRYDLPHASPVRLEVFDVTGRRVAVLVNRIESPGRKAVRWKANGVANGVYFYRLTAGEFTESRRMTLLR